MEWVSLVIAGCCEILGVAMLNRFNAQKSFLNGCYVAGCFTTSFACLSFAMKSLPMGLTYAIWTGIGGVGSALIGIMFYGESKEWKRLGCMGLIIVSVIGLKVA